MGIIWGWNLDWLHVRQTPTCYTIPLAPIPYFKPKEKSHQIKKREAKA